MALLDSVKPDDALTVNEVGKIIGFKRDTVIRLIKKGKMPAFRLPSMPSKRNPRVFEQFRVWGSDLIAWVQANYYRKR